MPQTNPIQPNATPGAQPAPATGSYPTAEEVKRCCPECTLEAIQQNLPYIIRAMAGVGLTSKNQLAGVIATIYVETRSFKPVVEKAPRPSVSGGPRYRGRGYLQITHDYQYKKFGQMLGIPLFENPELACQPETAAKIFMIYWQGKHNPNQNCQTSAEQGNWPEVRRKVNGSSTGAGNDYGRIFKPCIDRCLSIFKSGISGVPELPGNYGSDDYDTNGAPQMNINGGLHNPQSQLAALEYALGLMALDTFKALEAQFRLDVASQPEILNLDAQKTFTVKGLGEALDDEYTVEEVLFVFGDRLEAEVTAFKPDPNAPPPTVFRGDASIPDAPAEHPGEVSAATLAGGDISAKLWAASEAATGRSTSAGPKRGRKACAWSVNLYVIEPAGFKRLGGAGYEGVAACKADLDGGRGQKVPRAQAKKGDIWIDPSGHGHIGICYTDGCTMVKSNSSSSAIYGKWVAPIDSVNRNYSGGQEHIYRLLK